MKTIYRVMLGLFLFAIGITVIKSQEFNLTTYDSEFYVGFYKHFDIGQPQFYIHTFKTTPVSFNVTSLDGMFSYNGTCTHLNPAIVDIPLSYEVNGYDYSWRRKGLRISSLETEPISVIYTSHQTNFGDYMAYLAYPCHKQPTSKYFYYAVSTLSPERSQFLIVGCRDDTSVTIIPTGNITLPIDAQDMASSTITLTAGQNHSLVLHSMQTLLIFASNNDLTASKIISNQPITILSGQQFSQVPSGYSPAPIITQVTPTIVWGKQFLLSPHSGKVGQSYRIIASMDSTVIVRKCGSDAIVNDTLYADQWLEFFTNDDIYCSVVSNNPIYVAQLGVSSDYNGGSIGGPSINTVAPMEQYINSVQYTTLTASSHYYSVVMPNDEYYDGTLICDGSLQNISVWNPIYYSDDSIAGYGYSEPTTGSHTITHPDEQGKLFVSVYGWSFRGYSYAGGMILNPTFIDCGNPDDPDPNGDVSYIATTLGNTANYSCDYGYLLDVSQGGPVVVTCLASGVWSDTAPACSPVDCGNPDDPDPNGDVSYVATTLGNTANYSCDFGYLLDVSQGGSVVVTCLASGVWSDTAPACALLGLVSPPVINNNEIGSTTAIIRWNPPIHPNGEITSYTVEAIPIRYKEDPYDTDRPKRQTEEIFLTCTEFLNISAVISVTVGGNSLNATLAGLIPFTVYEVRVAASTVIGHSNFSNVTSFATAVDDPAPILELEGVARDLTSIVLSWEGPACPNGIVTGYYIYYRISNTIQPQPIHNSGYTKDRLISSERDVVYSITDLSPGQYYAIHVRAFTIDDNDTELIGMVDTEILVVMNDSRLSFESRPNTGVDDTSIGLPSLNVLSDFGIENITYYGVIVVPDPDMDFNPNVDDFNSTYPNVQPYESRGDNRYYIAAAWNDVSEVPNRFTAGDESRTMAMRSGVNETYFNAKLDRFTPHCYYVIIHHILSIGDEVVIRYYEVTCRDTRLGYNLIALIVCLILAFLILCGLLVFIIICCCYWCHHRWSKYPVSEKKEVLSQLKEPREEAKYEYETSSVSIAFRGVKKESKILGFHQGEEETST